MVQLSQDERRNAGVILDETGGWVICLVITRGRYGQYAQAKLTERGKFSVLLSSRIDNARHFNVRDDQLFNH
jgi:hypothetical protein